MIQVEPLTPEGLDETLRKFVCSNCWHALTFKFVEGKRYAICPDCQEDTRGYVSKTFADHARRISERERNEAAYNLRNVLGLGGAAGRTVANLLKEIGG